MAQADQPLRWDTPNLTWDDPRLTWNGTVPASPTPMDNRISATLSAEDVAAITAAIATIRTKLPFLVALTLEERKAMAKGGTKSQGVIQSSLTFANLNKSALPADFEVAEYAKDGALQSQFAPVAAAIAKLHEDVDDTLMVLNSELYLQSIQTYAFAKVNNRNGQYDSYIGQIKPYFAKPRKAVTPPPTPTNG